MADGTHMLVEVCKFLLMSPISQSIVKKTLTIQPKIVFRSENFSTQNCSLGRRCPKKMRGVD